MTTGFGAPLTERYSNPGAVEYKPWMQKYGATLGPNGRYAQFPNPDAGYTVMGKILDTYQNKHGLNTVSGIVNRWAPSNVDNNSTATYIAKVSAALGIRPDQPITPEQRPALMKAMADYEAGRAQPAPQNGAAQTMWPTAGQIDPNSPLAGLMGMYGRDASFIPAPPVAPRPVAVPAVASAAYRTPETAQQKPEEGSLASIVRGLTQAFNSPMFQAGAAMVDAGSRGQNIGAGFLAGGRAASAAAEQAAALRKAQQEELAQAQRQKFWSDITTNPETAKLLPDGTIDFLKALGPIDGPKVAMDLVKGNQISALDRMKLEETRRKNDATLTMSQAQLEESRNVNADRMLTQEMIRRQKQQEMEAAQRDAAIEADMQGAPPPPPVAPMPTPPPRQQQGPVRRMSDEQPAADPMLIQAQDAGPTAPAAPAQAEPPQMIRIPRRGGEFVTPQAAREYGQSLLMSPKFRDVGRDIIKQADEALKPTGEIERTTRGALQKDLIAKLDRVAIIDQIIDSHGEENIKKYMSVPFRVRQEITAIGDKFVPLGKKDAEDLTKYTTFRAQSARAMNEVIKELAGSAVTASEAARTLLAEPNAGTGGWFDPVTGDSPARYVAKLQEARNFAKLAKARTMYLMNVKEWTPDRIAAAAKVKNAQDVGGVSIDGMQRIMSEERMRAENQIRAQNPRAPENDIRNAVRQHMQGTFGI